MSYFQIFPENSIDIVNLELNEQIDNEKGGIWIESHFNLDLKQNFQEEIDNNNNDNDNRTTIYLLNPIDINTILFPFFSIQPNETIQQCLKSLSQLNVSESHDFNKKSGILLDCFLSSLYDSLAFYRVDIDEYKENTIMDLSHQDSTTQQDKRTTSPYYRSIDRNTYSQLVYIARKLTSFLTISHVRSQLLRHFSIAMYFTLERDSSIMNLVWKRNQSFKNAFQRIKDQKKIPSHCILLQRLLQNFSRILISWSQNPLRNYKTNYALTCNIVDYLSDLLFIPIIRKYVREYLVQSRIREIFKVSLGRIISSVLDEENLLQNELNFLNSYFIYNYDRKFREDDAKNRKITTFTNLKKISSNRQQNKDNNLKTNNFDNIENQNNEYNHEHNLIRLDQDFKNDFIRIFRLMNTFTYCLYLGDSEESSATNTSFNENEHFEFLKFVQTIAWKNFEKLQDLAVTNPSHLQVREYLIEQLQLLTSEELKSFAFKCGIISHNFILGDSIEGFYKFTNNSELREDDILLMESFVSHCENSSLLRSLFTEMPLYPTEEQLNIDNNFIHNEIYLPIPIPKLKLQYISLEEYFRSNYFLIKSELATEIQNEIQMLISFLKPQKNLNSKNRLSRDSIILSGSHPQCVNIIKSEISTLKQPQIGEKYYSQVLISINFDPKKLTSNASQNWEKLKENDVLFLCTLSEDKNSLSNYKSNNDKDQSKSNDLKYIVKFIRGAIFKKIIDIEGKIVDLNDSSISFKELDQTYTMILELDPVQFQYDQRFNSNERVYEDFQFIFTTSFKGNDYFNILKSLRDIYNLSTRNLVNLPNFICDVVLGHSLDPDLIDEDVYADVVGLFSNEEEIKLALNEYHLEIPNKFFERKNKLNIKFLFTDEYIDLPIIKLSNSNSKKYLRNVDNLTIEQKRIIVHGLKQGLNIVNGPSKSGKTISGIHIIAGLTLNQRNRTLVVCRNERKINDLLKEWKKIYNGYIPSEEIVVLHRNSDQIENGHYSIKNCLKSLLNLRSKLLREVGTLAKTMELENSEDISYSCETSGYFYESVILSLWERYNVERETNNNAKYPFFNFFKRANKDPKVTFNAYKAFGYIQYLFDTLKKLRFLELIHSENDLQTYLINSYSKLVITTSSELCKNSNQLLQNGFTYHSLIILESEQMLEIESVMPLLCQKYSNNLKRVSLFGNSALTIPRTFNNVLKKESRIDQSLFERLLNLDVSSHRLTTQFDVPKFINTLESYFIRNISLKNIKKIENNNNLPGLNRNHILVTLQPFKGQNEVETLDGSFYNLGEAEYIVQLFSFLILKGYKPEEIGIFTLFESQKRLINDILNRRCAFNPLIGLPGGVHTLNDISNFKYYRVVLLSIVRTTFEIFETDLRQLNLFSSYSKESLVVIGNDNILNHPQKCYKYLFSNPDSNIWTLESDSTEKSLQKNLINISNLDSLGQFVFDSLNEKFEKLKQLQESYLQKINELKVE